MMRRWQKPIYIASKIGIDVDDEGNEIVLYDVPTLYKFNVQPVSSEVDLIEFGEKASVMQRAVIDKRYKGIFKENDVAYLDGQSPEDEEQNGANANYRLYPPRNQNKVIIIYFERLSGK